MKPVVLKLIDEISSANNENTQNLINNIKVDIENIKKITGPKVNHVEVQSPSTVTDIKAYSPKDISDIVNNTVSNATINQINTTLTPIDDYIKKIKPLIQSPHPDGHAHLLKLGHNKVYTNINTGEFYANKVWAGVYNDYAEYRNADDKYSPGTVVVEQETGRLTKSNKRLSKCPMVITDTYGMVIGDNSKNPTNVTVPIGVSGRVLVEVVGKFFTYSVGDVLCAGKNGKACKMRWYEKILFPERILGIVSEIPSYDIWGDNKVVIGNRVWMKIM